MAAELFLIRHGSNDWLGRALAGREPGVGLNEEGRAQAEKVARRLEGEEIGAIYSSPLERAMQTAEPLSARLGKSVETCDELSEIDLGRWSGMALDALKSDRLWLRYCDSRSDTAPLGGELSAEVQARMVRAAHEIARRHDGRRAAIFSHADPIKVLLMHCLGMPLDMIFRLEISPGGISLIRIGDCAPEVLLVNEVVAPSAR